MGYNTSNGTKTTYLCVNTTVCCGFRISNYTPRNGTFEGKSMSMKQAKCYSPDDRGD